MRRSLLVFVSIVLLSFQVSDGQNCECDECIARGIDYQWCLDGDTPKCISSSEACVNSENPIIEPVVTRNDDFGSGVQIRPQEQRVQIRPGETKTLDFTFRPGDFPLDLYFLMDLGPTMETHFSTFRENIGNMVSAIQGVTSNVRIGFGSFVDKPVETFVGPIMYASGGTPCYLNGECFIPHSFVHHINLTDGNNFMAEFDTNAFRLSLQEPFIAEGISANASRKENPLNSGLDALAQVAECTQEIGWSETSRKVVVYISNSAFHLSSESWIAGIVRRQDGKCHLKPQPEPPGLLTLMGNENVARNGGFFKRLSDYEAAITQEYASPALVQTKLESNEIVPIFLIEQSQEELYQSLVNTLSQTNAVLFDLKSDSSNLASGEVLTMALQAVQSSIRLSPESLSNVEVTVNASCSTDRPNSCDGVTFGEIYSFQASVKVTACTEELRRSALLPISDPFLGSTVLNISSLCECNCSSVREENSAQCMSRGALTCGCCDCNDNFYGSHCQCEGDVASCPIVNGLQCSGDGTCDECNRCNCSANYYGDMCECSNITCRRNPSDPSDVYCYGNGDCVCNECKCNPGYTGEACDCPTNTSNCFDDSEEICNGRGDCVCGSCECQDGYVGEQCKFCRSATDARCREPCSSYYSCVRCLYSVDENFQFKKAPEDSCSLQCRGITMDLPPTTPTTACPLPLGACSIEFFIPISSQASFNRLLINQTPQNCDYPPPPWAFAIGIAAFIASLILGVVILLLLKLIVYLLDYMEYKRFEDDVNKTTFGENQNPLYRNPQTEHPNPLFKGKEKPSPPYDPPEKC